MFAGALFAGAFGSFLSQPMTPKVRAANTVRARILFIFKTPELQVINHVPAYPEHVSALLSLPMPVSSRTVRNILNSSQSNGLHINQTISMPRTTTVKFFYTDHRTVSFVYSCSALRPAGRLTTGRSALRGREASERMASVTPNAFRALQLQTNAGNALNVILKCASRHFSLPPTRKTIGQLPSKINRHKTNK